MRAMTSVLSTSTRSLTVNHGDRVLIAASGGGIRPGGEEGFYAADTRVLSGWELTIDGRRPRPIQDVMVRFYSSRHVGLAIPDRPSRPATEPAGPATEGPPDPPLVVTIERTVGDAVHEEIEVANAGGRAVRSELCVAVAADFADLFEVRGLDVDVPARRPETSWSGERQELEIAYRNETFARAIRLRCLHASSPAAWRDGSLVFPLEIAPHESWRVCLTWEPILAPGHEPVVPHCGATTGLVEEHEGRPVAGMRLETSNRTVRDAWDQASWDMEAIRLPLPGAPGTVVPAAGVPWYLTLFGRDAAVTSIQALAGYPELARGALAGLGALQGTGDDPERDMEPGKIAHEIRHGEVARLDLLPFQPYYGTHDATPLYVILLAYVHHWTADPFLLEELLPVAERAMGWIEGWGDRDGDGFLEYATRSRHGFRNQGWKDAKFAIPHADGSHAPLPIALCEHQGYAYDARLRLAELYDAVDRPEEAERLRVDAEALFQRFNEAFWWEAEGTYYLGLDGEKRPSAASPRTPATA